MGRNPLEVAVARIRALVSTQEAKNQGDRELLRAYSVQNDQTAFGVLVKRHGPLVFSVCKRVLHHDQDAEDAFQAVFIVLARKATSVRKHHSLAGWLHQVSHQVALAARRAAMRRRRHESEAKIMEPANPAWQAAWREVQVLLDEEIQRLQPNYREPFVLCHLENLSCAQAARRLGVKEGTVWSRLAEARKRLQLRLTSRGVALPTVLGIVAIAPGPAAASLPLGLAAATVRAATASKGGALSVVLVSKQVAALVRSATTTLALAKAKVGMALVLSLGALVGAAALYGSNHELAVARASGPQEKSLVEPKRENTLQPTRADRYGDPLPVGAIARLGTVRFRHGSWPKAIAFSPDGKWIASSDSEGIIKLWERETGREVRRFVGHHHRVLFVAFTVEGKHLISASEGMWTKDSDATVRLWNLETGLEVRRLFDGSNARRRMTAFALSPDGKKFALGFQNSICLLSITDGNQLGELLPPLPGRDRQTDDSLVQQLSFSPDGKRLVGLAESGVCCFDVATRRLLWNNTDSSTAEYDFPPGVAFSPDGKTLAVLGMFPKPIRILDADTGRLLRSYQGGLPQYPRALVCGPLVYSRDGKRLYARCFFGPQVVVWNVETEQIAAAFSPLPGQIENIALSLDGKTLAVLGVRSIRLCDPISGKALSTSAELRGQVDSIHVLAGGGSLLVASTTDYECGARLWNLTTGEQKTAFEGPVASVRLAPDSKVFAVGTKLERVGPERNDKHRLFLVNVGSGSILGSSPLDVPEVHGLAFSADGKKLISSSMSDRGFMTWDAVTLKKSSRLGPPPGAEIVKAVSVSPDNKTLASGGWNDGVIRLWEMQSGKELRSFRDFPGKVNGLAWSPDGRWVAGAFGEDVIGRVRRNNERDIGVWNASNGIEQWLAWLSEMAIYHSVAWSPDSRLIAGGGADHAIRIWERVSGQLRRKVVGHDGAVTALAFGPDGQRLFSGSSDTTVLVWDLAAVSRTARLDLSELWKDLAADATIAEEAIRTLVAKGDRCIPFLRAQLKPVPITDGGQIVRLIAQLNDVSFARREAATKELQQLAEPAEPALRQALSNKPASESTRRIEELLQVLRVPVKDPIALQAIRAIEVLEKVGTMGARHVIETIAAGAPDARLTQEAKASLERLARKAAIASTSKE